MLRQFVFDLLNRFRRRLMIPSHVRLFFAQLLAAIKLNDFAPGFGRLFNCLEDRKVIEGISLAADKEAPGFVFVRDLVFRAQGRSSGQCGHGKT